MSEAAAPEEVPEIDPEEEESGPVVAGTGTARLKKEFLIERQGKTFCLYQGLLDLAHQMGLVGIKTQILQMPSEENHRVALCYAEATFKRDGEIMVFTGNADAAPNNVSPAMQTCLPRMAETRAKARALRDGTNVGIAAMEELADDEGGDHRGGNRSHGGGQRASRPAQPRPHQAGHSPMPAQPAPQNGGRTPPGGGSGVTGPLCPECNAPNGRHATHCSKNAANRRPANRQ